jgi:putative chitinase
MNAAAFFAAVRKSPFGGSLSQSAVEGLNAILAAWETYGDGDENKLAYILGTAFHECDRFRTMEEYASGSAYEGRKDLGNTVKGDGVRFKGRGFVQITGRRNYKDWSDRLGVDLIANPKLASDRETAARILVQGMMLGTFTGKKLAAYVSGAGADFLNSRRVVNGMDKASTIAGYAKSFKAALDASVPVADTSTVPEPAKPTALDKLDKPVVQTSGFWERVTQIGASCGAIFAAAFGDWRVVVAIAAVAIVISLVGLLLHKRIINAVKSFKAELG